MGKQKYLEFTVDLWATDFHDVEIGILPKTQHRAKSRQFTKDMDIIGQIKEDGERTGLIAYREGLWQDKEGMNRRLVIKTFSPSMSWRATLELLLGRSLQLTHGAGDFPVVAYSVNVNNHPQVIQVERSAFKWPLFPEKFSFFILRDDKPEFYRLRKDVISIGTDYTLFDQHNRKIGHLDGKVITLGGEWRVRLEESHASAQMKAVLQLFCAMLKFNEACQDHISSLIHELHEGRLDPELEAQEADLYMNPRRMR